MIVQKPTATDLLASMYVMDGDTVRHPVNTDEFSRLNKIEQRRIGRTIVGDVEVSTVFLMVPHGRPFGAEPDFFETMIFGGQHDNFCTRYATREQAQAGHEAIVEALTAGRDPAEAVAR